MFSNFIIVSLSYNNQVKQRVNVKKLKLKIKNKSNLLKLLVCPLILFSLSLQAQSEAPAAGSTTTEADASVLEVAKRNQEMGINYPDVDFVICKSKGSVRTLRYSFSKSEAQCNAFYNKGAGDKKVAYGKNSKTCRDVINNIRYNLEKDSWKCRGVTNAVIHEGDPAGSGI